MLDKIKELYQAQKQMNDIKKKLESIKLEHEVLGGKIKIEMDGTQKVLGVQIADELMSVDKKEVLQRQLVAGLKGASDKVQRSAQQQLQASMGDLKIPGLGG